MAKPFKYGAEYGVEKGVAIDVTVDVGAPAGNPGATPGKDAVCPTGAAAAETEAVGLTAAATFGGRGVGGRF